MKTLTKSECDVVAGGLRKSSTVVRRKGKATSGMHAMLMKPIGGGGDQNPIAPGMGSGSSGGGSSYGGGGGSGSGSSGGGGSDGGGSSINGIPVHNPGGVTVRPPTGGTGTGSVYQNGSGDGSGVPVSYDPSAPEGPHSGGTSTTQADQEQLLEGLAKELQVLAADGEIPSDWVETGINASLLSLGFFEDNVAGGKESWQQYAQNHITPADDGGAEVNWPINWNHFDWSQVPGARTAPNYETALQDALNWANSKAK